MEQLIVQVRAGFSHKWGFYFAMQSIDQEVLDQSETFDTILRVDMLDWSDMFDGEGGEMEQALIDKTRDINEK